MICFYHRKKEHDNTLVHLIGCVDCLIIFNNFNHKISNNIIFDNIIFDNPYQTLEIKNNSLKKILIKEYPINHTNNGIIIINSYPYFLNKNLLPDFIEIEKF